ncbi:hypothetical protein PF010_g29410 [Phytophthora fragariae]|uniref:Uncharacterized protein n=1 Tax=Phytophthora fragariae TaxID=53985 RepID=A0A6G0JNX8_9STRA|nr:hypothetical protein PF010_g29410 [Phytophthora fragariae]
MTIIRHRLKFEFSVVASMKLNVSDTTCWFGLARTERGCVRTLASFDAKWFAVLCRLRPSGSQFGVVYGQVGRSLASFAAKWVAV